MTRTLQKMFATCALVLLTSVNTAPVARAEPQFKAYCGSALVILLADITTRYDDFAREQFISMLEELLNRLRHGERLVVRTIEDTFENSRVLFDACSPGCPSERAVQGLMSSCRPVLARAQSLQFKHALMSAVSEVHNNSIERNRSDLLNTLRFHMSFAQAYQEKELWFFSDMLENKSIRLLREKVSVEKLLARARKENLMVNLSGLQVRIYGMARTDHPDTRRRLLKADYDRVVGFWRTYLSANGASLAHLQE